ncbi:MoaD/ThiS family protein [Nocardioides sp. AE5]|uniref:MoaD/ThiS family protein n=1 Tax=Nocardioides sp. AE5 TaxID=2962573 RepID=UPI0028826873|nr:MoaD/ThiS family protein [Nocardioides sp. AE5]MDT0202563.1 MoaD/ThiS family protein [Nocardioides sp. AE5]
MSPVDAHQPEPGPQVVVRYWASARAVTGVNEDYFDVDDVITLSQVREQILARHPDAERVIGACSVLLDDEPVGRFDPDQVRIRPGQSVEFLPPFAGG